MKKEELIQKIIENIPDIECLNKTYLDGLSDMYDYLNPPGKSIEDREHEFKLKILEFKNQYPIEMLKNFFNHWSQYGENDRKMLFEKQKSFQISKRLATWKRNDKNYSVVEEIKARNNYNKL